MTDTSISAHVTDQLGQYKNAAAKVAEIKDAWQESVWKTCLSAHEQAAPLSIDPQERQLSSLDSKFTSGEITKDDLAAAIKWTSDLAGQVPGHLKNAKDRKTKLETELPASLVQLTQQVEYGRQFKEGLLLYWDKQKEEVAQQARLDIRERWKTFISSATALFAEAEAALSKAKITDIDAEYKSMFREIMNVGDVVPDLQRVLSV